MFNYHFLEFISLFKSFCLTKIFFRRAKIIRFPFHLRGNSGFLYKPGLSIGYNCRFDVFTKYGAKLTIGYNCQFNNAVHIACAQSVIIGDNCLVASNVFISDHNHGTFPNENEFSLPVSKRSLSCKSVNIGYNCWLGENVCILPGVTLGDNVVVGANTTVTKSFGNDLILVGSPARISRRFDRSISEWVDCR